MNGKDWHPSRSKPKLLLLMKTNFYLVDLVLSNCVPTFQTLSTCIVIILNGHVSDLLHEHLLFNKFLHLIISMIEE